MRRARCLRGNCYVLWRDQNLQTSPTASACALTLCLFFEAARTTATTAPPPRSTTPQRKAVSMQYFGVPRCPYCKKRVNLIRTWSLKRQGEYRCPRCGGISNIFLSPPGLCVRPCWPCSAAARCTFSTGLSWMTWI